MVAKMYTLLTAPPDDFRMSSLVKWERDLGETFSPIQSQNIINLALKSSRCTKIQELNYKILTRWYYTPARLNIFFPEMSDRCWRGCGEKGTMLHTFWGCPIIRQFWETVRRITQEFTEYQIPDDPSFFLLHHTEIPPVGYMGSMICHLINAAKSCIATKWKDSMAPPISMWLKKVRKIGIMEKLLPRTIDKKEQIKMIWAPWELFVQSE